MKIGLLGGLGLYTTNTVIERIKTELSVENINVYNLDVKHFEQLINDGKIKEVIEYISDGLKTLDSSNVDIIIIPCNTAQVLLPNIQFKTKSLILNTLDGCVNKLKELSSKSALLLATSFTVNSDYYLNTLGHKTRIHTLKKRYQEQLDEIIFKRLVHGYFEDKDKVFITDLIDMYSNEIDSIILGCTELGFIVESNEINIPIIDSLEEYYQMILHYYSKEIKIKALV